MSQQLTTPNQQPAAPALAALELEVLEFFVRGAQLLGLPRSIGEIYGLLYLSPEPLSMDQIVERLKISVGSASQGLRQLRGFRAVKTAYVPGQRKDHFVAEEEVRKVIGGFINEEIRPHLESGRERLDRMETLVNSMDGDTDKAHYASRIQKISRLHSLSGKLLPLLQRFIRV